MERTLQTLKTWMSKNKMGIRTIIEKNFTAKTRKQKSYGYGRGKCEKKEKTIKVSKVNRERRLLMNIIGERE